MRLLEALPDAVQNVKYLIQEMKSLPKEDNMSRELSYRASIKVLEAAGIVNTQAQNQVMINILNDNRTLISHTIETSISQMVNDFPKDPLESKEGANNE